ncbi:MAG: DEAD/DEAH box helicase [Verrucomicrobiota bacterium]
MPLAEADFAGFDLPAAQAYLRSFDSRTRKKGERYFQVGAVRSLSCHQAGCAYAASVMGGDLYQVSLFYQDGWDSDCSCPVGCGCKHVYAALRQLFAEHTSVLVAGLSAKSGRISSADPARPAPGAFQQMVRQKLGRDLADDESRYLAGIRQLFRRSASGGLHYLHELTGIGLPKPAIYWSPLELYPRPPKTEAEFWNYLALYLVDKMGGSIPEFMQPVTDLTSARAAMRRHFRARDVERWNGVLAQFSMPGIGQMAVRATGESVDFRARFLREQVLFEWRRPGAAEWAELKRNKVDDFEDKYAAQLSAEAALLWNACWQRAKMQYASSFAFADNWVAEQIGRWLRQPLLRPLFADEKGEPLIFHGAPLRWQVTPPEDDDGDYAFSLVQAGGEPVPEVRLAAAGRPTLYLTSLGVFSGPPMDPVIMSGGSATLIPAQAFESAGGLRLLEYLQTAPPPRLAARIRAVTLHPGIRAEVKTPWPGQGTEYCYLDVFGASDDGEHVESWISDSWIPRHRPAGNHHEKAFVQLDRAAVGALIPPLEAAGFKWDLYSRRWQLRITKKFAAVFVAFLKALPAATRIELGGELASFQNAEIAGKIRLDASEGEMDWFDLRVIVDVSDATLTKEEIKLLLDAKGGWVRLGKKGWRKLEFSLSREEDAELARLGLTPHELTSEPQRLHAFQLADQAARKFLPAETCERIERRATELQARITPEVPAEIRAEMRPYQRDGFHFLCYLATNHFGGILADDMGLGKTLQTLAWLAWLRRGPPAASAAEAASASVTSAAAETSPSKRAEAGPPSLVVCPKSVADNWQAEAAKFFPALKVRVWSSGELKSFSGMLASADLHVLNYSQLRLVGDSLARERFLAVILDEGQYIKNPSSQTAQIARQLRSAHRLILSGTPIENRLLDLWSLMSFAMPGALGSRAEFGRLFDAKDDPFARQRLAARVRPFLIRRTKAQVARDLPDRMEEDLFCEFEGEQKTLYRAELKRAQAMLLGVKTAAALNKERFNFLTSLLRLRQICCHPRLVKPGSKAASAKVEALIETLEPLIAEGQKVLVFSQFVGLLEILLHEVKKRRWHHWYLAGDTENRGDLVREFQSAAGAGVFLISLKAGGFGLNLTAASYVVLFDPWWNPAVENQAVDRTHRIGQTRKVMAYRLLIKDSIEEKIRALQKQKSSLANDVLGEEKFSQSLSLDDLRYLLAD